MNIKLLVMVFYLVNIFSVIYSQQTSVWTDVPEEIKSRKFFKRSEWFIRQRISSDGTLDYRTLFKEFEKVKEKTKQEYKSITNEEEWKQLGPKGIVSLFPEHWGVSSGRVRGIDVHPENPDIVYIGAASGGLWKTIDGGKNWEPLSNDFASNTFGAIAVDPINPDIVYAGTGEARYRYSPRTYYGSGMYKTNDGGKTWDKIAHELGPYSHFADIVVDPSDNNIIYAALAGGNRFLGAPGNSGIWRSNDGGSTWTNTLNGAHAFDLEIHPANPNIVYAALGEANSRSGFYYSNDKGLTWIQSMSGLELPTAIGRMQISISKSSPSVIYSVTYGSKTKAWKSTDGGLNWQQVSSGIPLGGFGGGWYDQGSYDLAICVNPVDPDNVFIGNVELHQTKNGRDFSVVRSGNSRNLWASPVHVDYHKIIYAPSDYNTIYIASDGGIFKSIDGGASWHHKNYNISTIQIYDIASHPTDRDKLVGGAQDNGNFRTTDGGNTNWDLATTGDGMTCFFDHINPNIVYLSVQYGNIFKSMRGGIFNTESDISPPYPDNDNAFWCAPFFMHPSNHNTIYVASRRLWRSDNAGNSWIPVGELFSSSINTMAQNQSFPEVMIFCLGGDYSSNPLVMISIDEGSNCFEVQGNIPGPKRFISRVKTHPFIRNTMYVVRSGFGSGKIYKTNDMGETWNDISGNLPDVPHNDLLIDPKMPLHLYAANDFGVYLSTNDGASWKRLSNGMPIVPVMSLDYAEYQQIRLLRAGTYGRSAYEIKLPEANVKYLTVLNPTKGEKFVEGTTKSINWISNMISEVSIEISLNNGQTWENITPSVQAERKSYSWLVPNTYSDECLVKISDFSDPGNFQIISESFSIIPLLNPILSEPQNGEMSFAIDPSILTWEKPLGGSSYKIQIAEDSAYTNIVYEDSVLTENSIEINLLENFKNYYWHVKAENENVQSGYSDTWNFCTEVGVPEIIYPQNNSTDIPLSFEFKWDKVEGADTFHLQVSENITLTNLIVNDKTVSNNFYSISGLLNGKSYFWRVKARNKYGEGNYSVKQRFKTEKIVGVANYSMPYEFSVSQNYPNPFNPSTIIKFTIPDFTNENGGTGEVTNLKVYDILGNELKTLLNKYLVPGEYSVNFDGEKFCSGVYFYKLTYGEYSETKKMLLVK